MSSPAKVEVGVGKKDENGERVLILEDVVELANDPLKKTINGSKNTMAEVNNMIEEIRNRIPGYTHSSSMRVEVPIQLINALVEFIGDPKFLAAQPTAYMKVLKGLEFHFKNDASLVNESGDPPSDIEELLQYKPSEVIGDKAIQIFCYLSIGDVSRATEELRTLKRMLDNPIMGLHASMEDGFLFLAKTVELFVNMVGCLSTGNVIFEDEMRRPSFKNVSEKGQIAVRVMQTHFFRAFRHSLMNRISVLRKAVADDPSNSEWLVILAETIRRKRRDSPSSRSRRPDDEEYAFIDKAYSLAPENPFVLLGLMDCFVDCLRCKGSFKCGGVTYDYSNDTVVFMKKTCRQMLKDFPRSIRIYSQISDYFARFVPLRYFDVAFAGECLEHAYALNPNYPKTTHRKGIYFRMSRGAITESFKWFKVTAKLDPSHYNAFMECAKNMIGRPQEYDASSYIETTLRTREAGLWSDHEILDALFFKGIADFVKGDKEKALEIWKIVHENDQWLFRLCELDQTAGFYNWDDNLISSDKLRLWMNDEKEKLDKLVDEVGGGEGDNGPKEPVSRRKAYINSLFELMIGIQEPRRNSSPYSPFVLSPTYLHLQKMFETSGVPAPADIGGLRLTEADKS